MALSNEAKESILQAMDIIATKASSQVAFDSTIKGVVVNNDNADNGYYVVGYGETKFTAYSENTNYSVNDCVRVSIPNNDFTEKKYIIGKWANEDNSEPITYTSVANTILEIVSLMDNSSLNVGIEANGVEGVQNISYMDISQNFEENDSLNTLFLEASFQSNLNNLKITGGTYGLRLLVYDKKRTLINTLTLDSSEFFGNPYSFLLPVRQSKKLNISDISLIGSIGLELYQKKDFFYYYNNEISALPVTGVNNIFVKSIKIGLGTDLSSVNDNSVALYCKEGTDYDSKNTSKSVSLLWYNKTKDNTYLGFSDGIAKKGSESYENYDENDFINSSTLDNNRKSQMIDEVPSDEKSLDLRANIFLEASEAIDKLYTVITKELIPLSSNFETRMAECSEIKEAIEAIRTKANSAKGTSCLESILNITRDVYQTVSYNKDQEISKNVYNNIIKMEVDNPDFNSTNAETKKSKKIWMDKSSTLVDKDKYFIYKEGSTSTENNGVTTTTDGVYVVKKPLRVRLKTNKKINSAIEQQFIDFFRFGSECQNYRYGTNPESVYPDYSLINNYYKAPGDEKTIFTSTLIRSWFLNNQYESGNKTNKPTQLCSFISWQIDNISNNLINDYPAFSGIWKSYKPKFEAINSVMRECLADIDNYLPKTIKLSSNKISIFLKDDPDSGTNEKATIVYDLNQSNYKTPWQSTLDLSLYENLYSIYWYRYNPGYEDETDHIISKDWQLIKFFNKENQWVNLGLPQIDDTGKTTLYWSKKTMGDNLPKLDISDYLSLDKKEEKFKVVIVFNHNRYESYPLIFSNVDEMVNLNLQEAEKFGFYIDNGSNSKDNYQEHYNFTNQLISTNDAKVDREVIARFKDENGHSEEVFNNSWIYWYVPDGATMINYDTDSLIETHGFSTDKYKTVSCVGSDARFYSYGIRNAKSTETIDIQKEFNKKVIIYSEKENIGIDDVIETKQVTEKGENGEDKIVNVPVKYGCIDPKKSLYVLMDDVSLPVGETDKDTTILFHPKTDEDIYYHKIDDIKIKFSKGQKIKLVNTQYYFGFNFDTSSSFKKSDLENTEDNYYEAKEDVTITCKGLVPTSTKAQDKNLFLINPPYDKEETRTTANTLEYMMVFKDGEKEIYKKVRVYEEKYSGWNKDNLIADRDKRRFLVKSDIEKDNASYKKKGVMNGSNQFIYTLRKRNDKIDVAELKVVKSEFTEALTGTKYYNFFDNDSNRTNQRFLKQSDFSVITPYYSKDGYYCFYKKIEGQNIVNNICTNCKKEKDSCKCLLQVESRKFPYQIKSQFSQDAINNNIMCGIEGEKWSIEQTLVAKNFFFGTYGTNGTEYSIQVTPSRSVAIEKINDKDVEVTTTTLTVNLYNGSGEEQNFPEPLFSWVGPTSCVYGITRPDYDGKGYQVDITSRIGEKKDNDKWYTADNYYALLKIIIQLEENITLESFYPVPYSTNIGYYIDGTTSVIYNSLGSLVKQTLDPYRLWSKTDSAQGEITSNISWEINYVSGISGDMGEKVTAADNDQVDYLPLLNSSSNTLIPKSLIVSNIDCYATVICKNKTTSKVLWAQPITMLQNCFESTTLNKWDGKFKIDNDKGTVLSSMLGAGKKENNNSFSGVLLGDVKTQGGFGPGAGYEMGIYGFHEGAASFAFRTDGTAFLGKSGKGRILFDGDRGFISSAFWDGAVGPDGVTALGTTGMLIDLETGHIDAHNFKLTSEHINFDSDGHTWMDIGDDDTYLRLSEDGSLEIKVTNFELTYNTGENLLRNTAPLDNVGELVSYDQCWYTTDPQDNNTNIISVDGHSGHMEIPAGTKLDDVLSKINDSGVFSVKTARAANEDFTNLVETYGHYTNRTKPSGTKILRYRKADVTDATKYQSYEKLHIMGLTSTQADIDNISKVWSILPLKLNYENFPTLTNNQNSYVRKGNGTDYYHKRLFMSRAKLDTDDFVIASDNFKKYFLEETKTDADGDSVTTYTLKEDIWVKTSTMQEQQSSLSEKLVKYYLPKSFASSQSYRKCLQVTSTNYSLCQDLKADLKVGKNYTLSGKIWGNSASASTIDFILEAQVKNGEVYETKTITQTFTVPAGQDWYDVNLKFRKIEYPFNKIIIRDHSDHSHGSAYKYTLFYQLKLEEGLCATPWTQSTEEDNYADKQAKKAINEANVFTNELNEGLNSQSIFNRLTNNGKKQGVFTDEDTGNFFISADTIGTGVLRSRNAKAKINYTITYSDDFEEKVFDEGNTSLEDYGALLAANRYNNTTIAIKDFQVTEGTYFDLNSGYLGAKKFELDAWSTNKGLYFNSNPDAGNVSRKYWFRVGDSNDSLSLYKYTYKDASGNDKEGSMLNIKVTKGSLVATQFDLNLGIDLASLFKTYVKEIDGKATPYPYDTTDYKACVRIAKNATIDNYNNALKIISAKGFSETYNYTESQKETAKEAVLKYYDLNNDGSITTKDANNIKTYYTHIQGKSLNLLVNKSTGFTLKDTENNIVFRVTPGQITMNSGLNITAKSKPNDQYYYMQDYTYSQTDANLCLAIAKDGSDKNYTDAYDHLIKTSGVPKASDLAGKKNIVKIYYDVNGDAKITSRDAKLIKAQVGLSTDGYGNFKMRITEDGFFCYRENDNGSSQETLFSIDYSGVYIKEYTNGSSGFGAADFSMAYGTGEPNSSTPGAGTDGKLYFKII